MPKGNKKLANKTGSKSRRKPKSRAMDQEQSLTAPESNLSAFASGTGHPVGWIGAHENGDMGSQAAHLNQAQLQTMQRQQMAKQVGETQGNHYLQRMMPLLGQRSAVSIRQAAPVSVQGSWLGDLVGDITDSRPDEARLDAEEDLADFMKQKYELKNHHPKTGRGLFDASYDPASGNMLITLKICFKFEAGDPTNAEWVGAVGGPAAAATYAPEQFRWQGNEAEAWKTNAIGDVQGAWSEQYTFHNTRPHWASLPNVNVRISIVEAAQDKAHYVTTIRKWPKDGGILDAVTPPAADKDQSKAHFEESSDNGITNPDVDEYSRSPAGRARYQTAVTKNPGQIFFKLGSAKIEQSDKDKLKEFGQTLAQPDMPPFPVTLTGHASSEGAEDFNTRLSDERAGAVSKEIENAGAKRQPILTALGETSADATPAWRKVDITIGDFTSKQETVLHEFGHMFGLGDEYATADDGTRPVGTPVAHSALAQRLIPGQQPILAHDYEGIMSAGEAIRPYHYVTFLEVLGKMTGTEGQWEIGPGRGPVGGPGDYPMPSASDKNTA